MSSLFHSSILTNSGCFVCLNFWYHYNKPFKGAESRREAWERIMVFYRQIMKSTDENVIIVSHGDTLSIFNAIWLGLDVEMLNKCDLFGKAGGVSFMHENSDGKHIITRLSDLSYIR